MTTVPQKKIPLKTIAKQESIVPKLFLKAKEESFFHGQQKPFFSPDLFSKQLSLQKDDQQELETSSLDEKKILEPEIESIYTKVHNVDIRPSENQIEGFVQDHAS